MVSTKKPSSDLLGGTCYREVLHETSMLFVILLSSKLGEQELNWHSGTKVHWPEIMWNHLGMLNQNHNDLTATWEMVNSRADYPQRAQQFRTSSCLSCWAGHGPGKGRWVAQEFRSEKNVIIYIHLHSFTQEHGCWCQLIGFRQKSLDNPIFHGTIWLVSGDSIFP